MNRHTPTPPTWRNAENRTPLTQWDRAQRDAALDRELRKRTGLSTLPSAKMQAWRDYEIQKFALMGRRGSVQNLSYNLYDDCVRGLAGAYFYATADIADIRAQTGRTAKTIPRHALDEIARAFGYRYLRGLDFIAHELATEAQCKEFRCERSEFRHNLELTADAAHQINDKGQNRAAALEVVKMFANELLALCPWLEIVGDTIDAEQLRNGVMGVMGEPICIPFEQLEQAVNIPKNPQVSDFLTIEGKKSRPQPLNGFARWLVAEELALMDAGKSHACERL